MPTFLRRLFLCNTRAGWSTGLAQIVFLVQAMKRRYRYFGSNRAVKTNRVFALSVSHRDVAYANRIAILMLRVSRLVPKAEFEMIQMFAIAAFY